MEALKPGKTMRLRTFFLQYLLFLSIGTILLLVSLLGLFTAAFLFNAVLPANYAEKEIEAFRDTLASSGTAPDRLPRVAEYAVFSKEGAHISGSLSRKEADHAWELIQQEDDRSGTSYYTAVQSQDEIWIFRYTLVPQYASPILRSYLPNPQLLGVFIFVGGILLQASVLAAHFGRRLSKKMAGLLEATENIQNENLEFTVQPSGIQEIDHVLASLDRMREALHTSLQEQWELERSRRDQISALAHDIKTPLTIIRGNAELLQETVQDDAQREYNSFILTSADKIGSFVQEVIDLSCMQAGSIRQKAPLALEEFLAGLELQMRAISSGRDLHVLVHKEALPPCAVMDQELLQRGIMNVIVNAVEHTPPGGSVTLHARSDSRKVYFTITDTGSGFSPTDLKEAATPFYRGDSSRSSGDHHGMGLYIAQTAAFDHGGELTLENTAPSGGARVTLSIPLGVADTDKP